MGEISSESPDVGLVWGKAALSCFRVAIASSKTGKQRPVSFRISTIVGATGIEMIYWGIVCACVGWHMRWCGEQGG